MKYFFRHWYNFNATLGLIFIAVAFLFRDNFSFIQQMLVLNCGVMNLHFFEEFGFPGGFPLIGNIVEKKSDMPDRYPLNQVNSFLFNNWFILFVYLPPILFPNVGWLVMGSIMFGFVEVVGHTFVFNIILKRWYNPGLATSLLGFLPVGVIFLQYVYANGGSFHWWEYVLGVVIPFAHYFLVSWILFQPPFASRDTKFPFAAEEAARGYRYFNK